MEINLVFEVRKDWELHFSCGSQIFYLNVTGRSGEDETILNLQSHKCFSGGNMEKSAKTVNCKHTLINFNSSRNKESMVTFTLLKMEHKNGLQETFL